MKCILCKEDGCTYADLHDGGGVCPNCTKREELAERLIVAMERGGQAQLKQIADMRAKLRKFAQYILTHWSGKPDHACSQCVPGGPIVVDGFACAYHEAKALTDAGRAALRGES